MYRIPQTFISENCYECPYTTPYRNSDITIADYWGIEKNAAEFDDDKGVNLLLIHTEKGQEVFEKINEKLLYRKTELSTSLQPNLQHPSEKGNGYECFWIDYGRLSTRRFFAKYFFANNIILFGRRVINKIKRIVRTILK